MQLLGGEGVRERSAAARGGAGAALRQAQGKPRLALPQFPKFLDACEPGDNVATMMHDDWQAQFRTVYNRGVAAWKEDRKSPASMFESRDLKFLASIGCTAQELFDFVDDLQRYGEPDFETALAVAAIRRDYFLNVLKGKSTGRIAPMETLPAKTDQVDGIAWLPRIIEKARLKLRGEMPADLMYGCGGDRQFIESVNMSLPEFLKLTWDSGDNDRRIIDTVKKAAAKKSRQ